MNLGKNTLRRRHRRKNRKNSKQTRKATKYTRSIKHKKTQRNQKRKYTNTKKHNNRSIVNHKKTLKNQKRNRKNKHNSHKSRSIVKKHMKGGNVSYTKAPGVNGSWMKGMKQVPPFTPPGGPYNPGSSTNGLGKGFYYKKNPDLGANADILTPNNKMNFPGKQNGGGLIPQDITNLGRNVVYGIQDLYSGYVGETLPPSSDPNPMYQPAIEKNMPMDYRSPDLNEIMDKSNRLAASYK